MAQNLRNWLDSAHHPNKLFHPTILSRLPSILQPAFTTCEILPTIIHTFQDRHACPRCRLPTYRARTATRCRDAAKPCMPDRPALAPVPAMHVLADKFAGREKDGTD
jgi:hypothetical protein